MGETPAMQGADDDVPIEPLAASEVPRARRALMDVYAGAFAAPPYSEPPQAADRLASSLAAHAGRAGFRMRVAHDPGAGIVGFAYGYASAPGQWWHDRVAASIGPEAAARWLVGAFEVVELAVLPAWQRRGIGGRLLGALVDGVEHRTAVLSTLDAETSAVRLYRRHGWRPVGHLPSPAAGRFLVMGLDLARGGTVGSAS
jgi:ribosomal protein S18 acetylase RimI-like enzyme